MKNHPLHRRLGRTVAALVAAVGLWAGAATAKDDLVIGITQFPSTFNPLIESMMAKSYILAMTRRPLTTYDKDWQLVCLLCTKLPTVENGLAVREPLPDGKQGIAITVTLQPGATWGDGTPVTTRDVVFTWEVGRHPKSGVGNFECYRRILRVDAEDERTFTLHVDRVTYDYNDLSGFTLLPAHLKSGPFADPLECRHRTRFDTDTANATPRSTT